MTRSHLASSLGLLLVACATPTAPDGGGDARIWVRDDALRDDRPQAPEDGPTRDLDGGARDGAVEEAAVEAGFDASGPRDYTPQAADSLPRMLGVRWSAGPELPRGVQEGALAMMRGELVHVGGYEQGVAEPVPEKPDRYPRGFSSQIERLAPGGAWRSVGAHPGPARQAHAIAQWRDSVIIAGGFNYDAPYTYADVLRMDNTTGAWTALQSLPWPWADTAMVVVGDTLYAMGGADYNAMVFRTSARRDDSVPRLGARLLSLDLNAGASARWVERAQLPGTPRFVHAVTVIRDKLYVFGGATYVENHPIYRSDYCNVGDNWRYDPNADRWERLRDAPMAIGYWPRGRLTFRDRYAILPGGTARSCIVTMNDALPSYGTDAVIQLASYGVAHNVLVYDSATDSFGTATPMPVGNIGPNALVEGSTIHIIGGETGRFHYRGRYFANQPDLYLRGELSESERDGDAMPLSLFSVWPGRAVDRAGFIAAGTCDPRNGDVLLVGPDSDPVERRVPCVRGLFERMLTYAGPAGNRSIAVDQVDARGARTRGHDISVYFAR